MEVNTEECLFVDFEKYCGTCKHNKKKEHEQPCRECLEHPTNTYSHKPVRWEEK